jgi:hypothetical protein
MNGFICHESIQRSPGCVWRSPARCAWLAAREKKNFFGYVIYGRDDLVGVRLALVAASGHL